MRTQPAEAACLGLGDKIGPYTIVKLLSQGVSTNTAVYKARRHVWGGSVALKVAAASHGAAVRDEASTIDRIFELKHRNIVRLIPTILDDGNTVRYARDPDRNMWYFAMEYLPGGSLANWMDRRKPIPLAQALEVVRQVGAGLDAAHHAGIWHLDVKPSNILFRHKPDRAWRLQVVLSDFGIARMRGQDSDPMRWLTPQYASPEQVRHALEFGQAPAGRPAAVPVGPASDLYSLTTILYEMLSGHLPFELKGRNRSAYLHQVVSRPPRLPTRGIPPEWTPVVLKGLDKSPASRYTTAKELMKALKAAGLPDDAQAFARRKVPAATLAFFAVGLGLAAGLVLGQLVPPSGLVNPNGAASSVTPTPSPTASRQASLLMAPMTPSPPAWALASTGRSRLLH